MQLTENMHSSCEGHAHNTQGSGVVVLKEDKAQIQTAGTDLSYAMPHSSSPGQASIDIVVWEVECSSHPLKVTKWEKWVPSPSLA